MIKKLRNRIPSIHEETFIAENSSIIGEVTVGLGTSVWYGAVLRGDINYVKVGEHCTVQDNAVLHVALAHSVDVGDYTNIGHNAVVHGCKIGNNCLIGMGAIVLNGAVVGDNCIIGAGSVVTQGAIIPDNSLVVGIPGKVIRQLTQEEINSNKETAIRYENLWRSEYLENID